MAIGLSLMNARLSPSIRLLINHRNGTISVIKRHSGHGNQIVIKPSEFQWKKFKDVVHLYTMVGLIPAWIFAAYHNIFTGHAILTETPEGYVPEYYETEKHPITRIMTKRFMEHPRENYERRLHNLNVEAEKVILRKIEHQVKNIMKIRGDYRSWYFWPIYAKPSRRMRDAMQNQNEREGLWDPIPTQKYGGLGFYGKPFEPKDREHETFRKPDW